jgi:hypothetical protein
MKYHQIQVEVGPPEGNSLCPLWVKSSRSKQAKSYHLSGWYWGIPDTRHSEYPGMPVAAFGQKQPLEQPM